MRQPLQSREFWHSFDASDWLVICAFSNSEEISDQVRKWLILTMPDAVVG
jgi:hypothetical protein